MISVSDRTTKINGEMQHMIGFKNLVATQHIIASENGIAFWNLVDAMGIDGGMEGYVKSKPSKANLDYTHINRRGGELVAKRLFESLEYALDKYKNKKLNDKN